MTASEADGSVAVLGTRWWDSALAQALAGKPAARRKVVVRYDSEDMARPALVEDLDGRRLAVAEAQVRVPVLSTEAAEQRAKDVARLNRLAREQLAIHRRLSVQAVAAALDEAAAAESPAEVVEMPGIAPPALAGPSDEEEREHERLAARANDRILQLVAAGGE